MKTWCQGRRHGAACGGGGDADETGAKRTTPTSRENAGAVALVRCKYATGRYVRRLSPSCEAPASKPCAPGTVGSVGPRCCSLAHGRHPRLAHASRRRLPPAADRPVQLFVLAGLHPRKVGAQHSLDAPPRSSSSCWALSRPATYSTPEPVTRGRTGLSLARPELCMRVPASCSSTCDTAPRPRPIPSWPVPRLRPRYPRPHTWASRGAEAKARLEM